jgi:hypothetical protein
MWHNSAAGPEGPITVQHILRRFCFPTLVALVAGCGGGSSESGTGSATPFTGTWFLAATFNVNVGGTATFVTDTSRVVVGASGNAVITNTDSECSLNVFVNGDVMTYETTCVFTATSEDATAPCVLTLRTRAPMRGAPGDGRLSSSFGPDTEVCSGAAVSYAGNLVGSQSGPPGVDTGGDSGDDD